MQYNLPKRIQSEADLKFYENYLQNEKADISYTLTLENFLQETKGHFAKIEFLNGIKTGVITNIGKDFLILRRNGNNTLIPFKNIKSIILPRGN